MEAVPQTMFAVVTTGNGGLDKLELRYRHPVPQLTQAELSTHVLVKVLAAGVNNTEINTRLGWYSKTVSVATNEQSTVEEKQSSQKQDGGWDAPTPFPFIQGTDCCGVVVRCPENRQKDLLNKRVIIRPCMKVTLDSLEHVWMASDFDGAFCQYVKVPSWEVFVVDCKWSDCELASVPCAYVTSENMLHRANVGPADHVLVTGASGGCGSATIQLAKRRGAKVTAIVGTAEKATALKQLQLLGKNDRVIVGRPGQAAWTQQVAALKDDPVTVLVDNVGGPGFPALFNTLKRGGRLVTSGAIAGPLVELDFRTLYLKDLTLVGCTSWDAPVMSNLIRYIEAGEIKPLIAQVFPMQKIAEAQTQFLKKKHLGKFVLVPPPTIRSTL